MASSDTLQLGLSGLIAAQRALNTTGHNITNVGTDGFSRQRAEQTSIAGTVTRGGLTGSGVSIAAVRRSNDAYLGSELNRVSAEQSGADTQYQLSLRLDRVLSDASTGLANYLNEFSAATDAVARDPGSLPDRQVMLSEAERLSSAFQTISSEFANMEAEVNTRLQTGVADINELSGRIAQLNDEIGKADARGVTPNDLLDQRDSLIQKMSEKLGITTLVRANGSMDVLTRSGESIVYDNNFRSLSTAQDPLRADHMIITNSAGNDIGSDIAGGEIGGLLSYRSEVLDPARASFGRLAAGMSLDFNTQHKLGIDLNGTAGSDFFTAPTPRITVASGNTGGSLSGAITDSSALTTSEYLLVSDDGADAYTLTRLSDNQTFAIDTGGTSPFTNVAVDGVQLTITAGAAAGDSFLVQPVHFAPESMSVALTNPNSIAATNPVVASISINNTGDSRVDSVVINSTTNLPLSGAPVSGTMTLTFDSANNRYTLSPDPSGESPLAYTPSSDAAGKTFSLLGGSLQVTVSGTPDDGDQLILGHNSNGSGDNRNAEKLSQTLSNGLLEGGDLSLVDGYASLVSQVGTQTRSSETSQQTFSNMLSQTQTLRDSVAGVNLDEEAANLLKFQQAYSASAQVISAADNLFNTLMQAVSR